MAGIEQILEDVRRDGRTKLTEFEAKQVLAAAGIAGTREELATSEQTAVSSAQKLGYPVVLKISSPDVLHKTDAGGVKLGLDDEEAVGKAFDEIIYVAKRSSLLPITIDSYVFTSQCLNNKITHHSSVIWIHSWSVGVKNSDYTNIDSMLAMIIKH